MTTSMEARQAYQNKVKAELDKINAQIAEYRAKADKARAETAVEYNSQAEELLAKRDAAQVKLEELQQASEAAWEDVQRGFEQAWTDLGTAFQSAIAKLENSLKQ
ncbi:MAG: hypothetical protein F6K04_18095 [Leptolyngbya sp. SIO4C5]|nr:hypothetical protein [Leptolyngbya sp. SIO4C5]